MAKVRDMIRVLVWLGQLVFVAPALYSSVVALWGLKSQSRDSAAMSSRRVRIVIAAHDEEVVIGSIAADLVAQDHPSDCFDAWVIADRCTDRTAEVAGRYVNVAERKTGTGGKGAAIAWFLEEHPLEPGEVLLVIDADNRIDPDFVRGIAKAVEDGNEVVQGYLDVGNPDGSALATANALTYWASNRMVQLARTNIGWSCDLGGTGMAFTCEALEAAGGFADDLADDLSLNVRLNLAGYRSYWVHDLRIYDEKPTGTSSSITQRARWVRGKRAVQREYGSVLVGAAVRTRQPALLDLAYRLYNPGRSFVALAIALFAVIAAVFPGIGLWPWWVLATIALVVVLLPVVFLAVDGVPGRYLIRYPYVTLIAILWLPIRIASRLLPDWRRTAHTGS